MLNKKQILVLQNLNAEGKTVCVGNDGSFVQVMMFAKGEVVIIRGTRRGEHISAVVEGSMGEYSHMDENLFRAFCQEYPTNSSKEMLKELM